MNIAYIFTYFGDGGAEEHALTLAIKAREAGESPIFIVDKFSNVSKQQLEEKSFKIIKLSMNSSFNIVKVLKSASLLKEIIKSNNIDIIHAHMLREHSIAIVSKFLGAKFALVRTFHRFDQFNLKMKPLMSIYRRYTNGFIATSDLMKDYLDKNGLKGLYDQIDNGVERVDVDHHDKAIGFIGRLASEKGILKFIEANINILRKNKLIIAGDGPDCEAINRIIKSNNLKIELLGVISNKADFFEKISVLVLPSETEVLPLVVIEAYSCGLPVAVFDIGPLRKLVKTDNGVLVEFANYAKLGQEAQKLSLISSDYSSTNIETYEKKYSADIMWSRTLQVYRSALDRSSDMLK